MVLYSTKGLLATFAYSHSDNSHLPKAVDDWLIRYHLRLKHLIA